MNVPTVIFLIAPVLSAAYQILILNQDNDSDSVEDIIFKFVENFRSKFGKDCCKNVVISICFFCCCGVPLCIIFILAVYSAPVLAIVIIFSEDEIYQKLHTITKVDISNAL